MDEYTYEVKHGVTKKAVCLCHKPHNYCDAVTAYYFETAAAAYAVAKRINESREHQFSDYADVTDCPVGAVLKVVEPYDD